jgi:hypothetical protein
MIPTNSRIQHVVERVVRESGERFCYVFYEVLISSAHCISRDRHQSTGVVGIQHGMKFLGGPRGRAK